MRVLHVLASRSRSWGGPPMMVANLSRSLAQLGIDSVILALDRKSSPNVEFADGVIVRSCGVAAISRMGIPANSRIIGILTEEISNADVVHIHEIWHFPHVLAAVASHFAQRRYILSPHGEIEPLYAGAHVAEKVLLWHLYQRRILNGASMVHALTAREERNVKLAGVKAPIRVVPNGVDVEIVDQLVRKSGVPDGRAGNESVPYILYLGRIDPKKNIDVLLEAFSIVAKATPEIQLVIAGPDPYKFWRRLSGIAAKLELGDRLQYLGFIDESLKFRLIANAKLFVLPSMAEGLSMAALEALACRTPVVASETANLPEVQAANAGRVVSPTPQNLAGAFLEILEDDALRESMRSNARGLVERVFSSTSMARGMATLYRELLSQ